MKMITRYFVENLGGMHKQQPLSTVNKEPRATKSRLVILKNAGFIYVILCRLYPAD